MKRKYEKEHPLRVLFTQAKRSFEMWAIRHTSIGRELLTENQHLREENARAAVEKDFALAANDAHHNSAAARWITQVGEYLHLLRHDDMLTTMLNKTGMHDELDREHKRAERSRRLCVLLADLNGFKGLNDSLGHAEGDNALWVLEEILNHVKRPYDMIARTGGDEITFIIPDCDLEQAMNVARRYTNAVDNDPRMKAWGLTIAIGVAGYEHKPETMLLKADQGMYIAKAKCKTGPWHSDIHGMESDIRGLTLSIAPIPPAQNPTLPRFPGKPDV